MNVKVTKTEILSARKYTLKKVDFELELKENHWEAQCREVFDRGNGATILLFNKAKQSVVLTRQFRVPTYLNGNPSGMMIEACAGSIEDESPEETMIRETEEETGYRITKIQKIFEAYMSPAAVTEIIHFYIAEYDESMKKSEGGGLKDEHEHIQVLEVTFQKALDMIKAGEIRDGKTIMLLQYAALNNLI